MASDRDRLLKAFIAGGKNRRRKSPFPSYPTGGRNTGVAKGRSDVNMPLYRSSSGEPPRRGQYNKRFIPGFGGYFETNAAKKVAQAQALHDKVTNRMNQRDPYARGPNSNRPYNPKRKRRNPYGPDRRLGGQRHQGYATGRKPTLN